MSSRQEKLINQEGSIMAINETKEDAAVEQEPTADKLQKKKSAHAILGAYGAQYPKNHQDKARIAKPTWEGITRLSDEIRNYIAQMASDINESVEMVKIAGCQNPVEFNAMVLKTNDDIMQFTNDFLKVAQMHAGRTGFIKSPDDLALSIQVHENYNQFRVKFEGVMHHSLISFTELALQARDRWQAKEKEEEAALAAEAAAPTQPAENKDA